MPKKFIWIGIVIILPVAFLAWLFIASSKPLPGQKVADLGREHVPVGSKVEYNSNPPTSGKHYGEWVRAGVYEGERDDRNLVHSLEHGYIVMTYRCVIATPSETRGKQSSTSSSEIATGSSNPRNDECEERKNQLNQIYDSKGKRKLIVIPRSNLDTNFALTAWTYLDKFDEFDSKRVEKFIDSHRDQGPEKTRE